MRAGNWRCLPDCEPREVGDYNQLGLPKVALYLIYLGALRVEAPRPLDSVQQSAWQIRAMGTGYQRLTRGEGRHDDEVWHCRFSISRHLTDSIVTLKLVFERFDVPLFEALGAELGAKQADGAVLERKAALVAAGGVPRPLFRSPIRTIATRTATPLISGGAVKGSTDWLDPEEPSRWLPAFLKRWILRPRKPRSVPGSASGVREGSGSWARKRAWGQPGNQKRNSCCAGWFERCRHPSTGAGGIGRKPAAESGRRRVSLDSDTIVLSWEFVR